VPSFHVLGSRTESSRHRSLTKRRSNIAPLRCSHRPPTTSRLQRSLELRHQNRRDVLAIPELPVPVPCGIHNRSNRQRHPVATDVALRTPQASLRRARRSTQQPTRIAQYPRLCILSVGHTALTQQAGRRHHKLAPTRRRKRRTTWPSAWHQVSTIERFPPSPASRLGKSRAPDAKNIPRRCSSKHRELSSAFIPFVAQCPPTGVIGHDHSSSPSARGDLQPGRSQTVDH
jgi:hypothetical protein